MNECSICRQPLPVDAEFCPDCGTQVQRAVTGATERLNRQQCQNAQNVAIQCSAGLSPMNIVIATR